MTKHEAASLASEHGSRKLQVQVEGTSRSFGRGHPRVSIFEVGEGCACSMLTDNADWNAAKWEFEPAILPEFASTLAFISDRAPNGFAIEAVWIGEKPNQILKVSHDELLDVVRRNSIATKARYIVSTA